MRLLAFLAAALTTAVPPVLAGQPVAVPTFSAVQLDGGGEVLLRNGSVQRVTLLEGSSAVTRIDVDRERSLKIEACPRRCPANYRLRVLVETPWLPAVAVQGGGAITLDRTYGSQESVAAAVRGGGTIDLRSTSVNLVAAAVTGGGDILVGAPRSLVASVNGGGNVHYTGDPRVVVRKVRGGGGVQRL